MVPNVYGPAPVQLTVQLPDPPVVVQPVGTPVTLLQPKLTAVPPVTVGADGEVMLETVLMRLVALLTAELPERGSAVDALLCLTEDVPEGGTKAQDGLGAVVL